MDMNKNEIPPVNIDEIMEKIREEAAIRNKPFMTGGVPQDSGSGRTCRVEDLLRYDDEEFIEHAYLSILRRSPDAGGFNLYSSGLRTNKLNKIRILGALRYSKEGRENKIRIKGLLFRYLLAICHLKK